MAKLTRTKEIWHIPKRGNVHQTIYMVYVLSWDKFLAKSWSSGKQEALGSEMGKVGLTNSGKTITHQSVRTLLANLPKYLGFVYIDESSQPPKIIVTDVGYELLKNHQIKQIRKHKNLKEYARNNDLIESSEVFEKQMSKLIITNPTIRKDCQNVLVFPFRMTLKLLLELKYLDMEEIGYILFHTKAEDEFPVVLEKIKTFRTLPPERRTVEIEKYEKTEEGKLTLVKAPTAGYYMYLCTSTGLCKRNKVKVNKKGNPKISCIELTDEERTKEILNKFENAEIYDFGDNISLWMEYFGNPVRIYPPHDIIIRTNSENEILVTVYKDRNIVSSDSLINGKTLSIPVFNKEEYCFMGYDIENGNEIFNKKTKFSKEDKDYLITIEKETSIQKLTKEKLIESIEEMFSGKYEGFDRYYYERLKTLEKIIGKNYVDNRRRGGRLEYLFFDILCLLKEAGIIDEVFWYGKKERYGICEPAPGGKEGNPDIVFYIDDHLFVLELTTFRGNRAQWNSAEASSVPDHISKFKRENLSKKVIGIFSAPSIHRQLEQNLMLNAKKDNVGMIFQPCIEFSKLLSNLNRKELKNKLIEESERQIKG